MGHRHIFFVLFMSAKEVKSLLETSQSTFSSKLSELGLAESLGPKTEYTLLAPFNNAFTSELKHVLIYRKVALFCGYNILSFINQKYYNVCHTFKLQGILPYLIRI